MTPLAVKQLHFLILGRLSKSRWVNNSGAHAYHTAVVLMLHDGPFWEKHQPPLLAPLSYIDPQSACEGSKFQGGSETWLGKAHSVKDGVTEFQS